MGTGSGGHARDHIAFGTVGIFCLLAVIGIYESQVTVMFFDKSIDVTVFVLSAFAASLLAPLVGWMLGPRGSLALTAAALALATIVATLVRDAQVELAASTVGLVAGMWWLALFASIAVDGDDGSSLRRAAPLGLALSLIVRAATRTQPLDEIPMLAAVAVDAALLIALAWSARSVVPRATRWTAPGVRGVLALFALPFVFALASDVAFNGAVLAGAAGLSLGPQGAASTYTGTLAAGVGTAAALIGIGSSFARGPVVAAALLAGGVLLWTRIGALPLLGGALLSFGLVLAASLLLATVRRPARVPIVTTTALGLGWIVAIVAALAYYIGIGLQPALYLMVALVAGIAALAAPARHLRPSRWLVAAAALAIVLPALTVATTPSPAAVSRTGELRVMTYNIHLGYDDNDVTAIDAIARAIAAESPDLVGMEEVTRGTAIAGGHDVLALLAERLGMSYAYAPMLGDVEGVAILSRLPIEETRVIRLARSTRTADLPRVALMVRAGGLSFVATHLGGDDFVTQVRSLIDGVRGIDHVIVSGDLNSVPDSPQMRLFSEAGFTDLGAGEARLTFPPAEPTKRIDYVWALGVSGRNVRTPQTSASDHLPVVADVTAR